MQNAPVLVDLRNHVARVPAPPRRPGSSGSDGRERRASKSFDDGRRGSWAAAALSRGGAGTPDIDEDEEEEDTGVYGVHGCLKVAGHTAG